METNRRAFGRTPGLSTSPSSAQRAVWSVLVLVLVFAFVVRAHAQSLSPPPVTVLRSAGALADGLVFIGPQAIGGSTLLQGAEILDNQGRVVWYRPVPDMLVTDVRVQTYLGKPVLTWSQAPRSNDTTPGDTTNYILDNTYNVVATIQAGNGLNADVHDFLLTPQNTALIPIYNDIPADLSSVGGPVDGRVLEGAIQEIEVATGRVLFEWHSLPAIAVTETYSVRRPSASNAPFDYFHLNSVSLDTDGNILVSARHTWAVYKINRTTGAIMWRLGGKKSDFTLGADLPFSWQHDAVAVDDHTIRIFDNASNGTAVRAASRVIWVTHDDVAMTAQVARSIVHPEALSVLAEGGAQSLPNGNTFVDWGFANRFSEFDASGQLLFDASQPSGFCSYRAYRFPWTGTPSTPPAVFVERAAGGALALHAVWNGATEVATWEVFAGETAASLAFKTSAAWNGFDTLLTLPAPETSLRVVAKNSAGTVIGTSDIVTGRFPPVFPAEPVSIATGGTVVFSVDASPPALNHQWQLDGDPLSDGTTAGVTVSGATTPSLLIRGATAAHSGTYTCTVSNVGQSVTSDPATLTVVDATADAGRLVNLACRAAAGTGDNVLIVGFVVGGDSTSGSAPLLIRAAGPALAPFGVVQTLPHPQLELYRGNEKLAANSGWAGADSIVSHASLVGASPWSDPSSLDAALSETLSAGAFTNVISGTGGNTGVALAEVFDATPPGSRLPSSPRLINLSGRAQVGTGEDILIAGFVIGGTTAKTVLLRASGPALANLNVSGPLPDPALQLYRSNGDGTSTLLAANTGWAADAQIAAVADAVGAFSWGTSATADSAILLTLPPGAYSAHVLGAGGDTGVALVEIYEVP